MAKRLIALLLAAFLCLCGAYAQSVRALGTGQTVEEARADAIAALSLNIEASVTVDIRMGMMEDAGGGQTSTFQQTSTQTSDSLLLGLKESSVSVNEAGLYEVEVYIDEGEVYRYEDRLEMLHREISALFEANDDLEDYRNVPDSVYNELLSLLSDYSSYRNVAVILDPEIRSRLDDLPVSISQVEAQWDAKLSSMRDALERDVVREGLSSYFSSVREENAKVQAEFDSRLDELMKSYNQRYRDISEQTMDYLGQMRENLEEAGQQSVISGMDEDLSGIINGIEARKAVTEDFITQRDEALASLKNEMDEEVEAYRDLVMSQPYTSIDMDSDGKIKESSIQIREDLIADYRNEILFSKYSMLILQVLDEWNERIAASLVELSQFAAQNSGRNFTITSPSPGLSLAITSYDTQNYAYLGFFSLSFGDYRFVCDLNFTYEEWTGRSVPSDIDVYIAEYTPIASQWLDQLRDDSSPVGVDVSLTFSTTRSAATIKINKYTITRYGDAIKTRSAIGVAQSVPLIDFINLDSYFIPRNEEVRQLVTNLSGYESHIDGMVDYVDDALTPEPPAPVEPVPEAEPVFRLTKESTGKEILEEITGRKVPVTLNLDASLGFGWNWRFGGFASFGFEFAPFVLSTTISESYFIPGEISAEVGTFAFRLDAGVTGGFAQKGYNWAVDMPYSFYALFGLGTNRYFMSNEEGDPMSVNHFGIEVGVLFPSIGAIVRLYGAGGVIIPVEHGRIEYGFSLGPYIILYESESNMSLLTIQRICAGVYFNYYF